jgi:hypothetical protein
MGLTDQFFAGEAADGYEGVVAVGDAAIKIGRGDQSLIGREQSFMLGYGQIHTHLVRFLYVLLVCSGACGQGSGKAVTAGDLFYADLCEVDPQPATTAFHFMTQPSRQSRTGAGKEREGYRDPAHEGAGEAQAA